MERSFDLDCPGSDQTRSTLVSDEGDCPSTHEDQEGGQRITQLRLGPQGRPKPGQKKPRQDTCAQTGYMCQHIGSLPAYSQVGKDHRASRKGKPAPEASKAFRWLAHPGQRYQYAQSRKDGSGSPYGAVTARAQARSQKIAEAACEQDSQPRQSSADQLRKQEAEKAAEG